MKGLKILFALSVVLTLVLAACAPATPQVIEKEVVVEKPVVETVIVEKEVVVEKPVVETVVVEKEVVVTATPQELKTIKLGLTVQFTGAEALSGQNQVEAAQMAVDAASEAGWFPGYVIRFVKRDNATATAGQMDPGQAAANARGLAVDPEIVANVGPQSSTAAKAMIPILAEAGLVTIASGPTNPDLTNPKFKEYRMSDGTIVFFRCSANDSVIPPAMASYAHKELGVNTLYLIDDGGAYGVGVGDSVEAYAKDIGVEVIGRDRVDPQAADYGVLITKIKGVAPDGVFVGAGYLATGKFALQSKGRLDAVFMGTDNVAADAFIENATPEGAEGWYGALGSPDITKIPECQKFTEEFKARVGRAPNAYNALLYDGVTLLMKTIAQLVDEGKPVTREAVRDRLRKIEVTGITGPMAFDENGDPVVSSITFYRIEGGKVKSMAPPK